MHTTIRAAIAAVSLVPGLLVAQSSAAPPLSANPPLRALVKDLFKFGDCGEALCLKVNAEVHGSHFAPSAQDASASLINFFTDAIGNSVSNIPIGSSSGGATFSFSGGQPVKTSVSTGPIFAERAQTIGRGRFVVGGNFTQLSLRTFRGLPLNRLEFNFTHQNVGSPVPGDPIFENDVIQVHANLDLSLLVTTASLTYGLLDNLDVGIALPLVHASLTGTSIGTVVPFGPGSPHAFGDPSSPTLSTTGAINGSNTGIGDIAARVKYFVSERQGISLFGDVRLPTGDADQLRGSGAMSLRALAVFTRRYHDMSPHANLGVLVRTGDAQKNAIISTIGFDQLVSESLTLAADVLGEIQIGDNAVASPAPVILTEPYRRTIAPTNLPGSRDHVIRAALGLKYTARAGTTAIVNALVPLRAGGLQPSVAWTAGLEFSR